MTNIIIVVAIIAIIALLVVRSRQNKESTGVKSKKSASKTTAKSSTKSTKKAEPEPTPVTEPAAPTIDLATLTTKIDLLVNDKEYAKAEGLINQTLKQDSSLQPLYEKLLVIYHAQEDEFAVKQLLETLQKLNLNEAYQRIYDDHETFKAELSKRQALEASNKTPDVFEFTPSTPDNSSSFDSLSTNQNDTDLRFASLDTDVAVAPSTDAALDFNLNTPTPVPSGVHEVDFQPSSSQSNTDASTLDFQLDQAPATESEAPTVDFKLDTAQSNIDVEAPTLDFNIEVPKEEKPANEGLSFNLDTPTAEPTATPSFDFSLDSITPATTSDNLNFTDEKTAEPEPQTSSSASTGYADANDPIVQSFSELSEVNPVDLDIQLAEQYIRLGAIDAAKSLLTANHEAPSAQQLEKIESLMQKIA